MYCSRKGPKHLRGVTDFLQVLGDEEKRDRYDRGEDIEEQHLMGGHRGHSFFQGPGGQTFTFHF